MFSICHEGLCISAYCFFRWLENIRGKRHVHGLRTTCKSISWGKEPMLCYRILWCSSSCLRRLLRAGQDKPLKNKGSWTVFTPEQAKNFLEFWNCPYVVLGTSGMVGHIYWLQRWYCCLVLRHFFNILGHQWRFRHRAWKVRQLLLRGSNFDLRFFYIP